MDECSMVLAWRAPLPLITLPSACLDWDTAVLVIKAKGRSAVNEGEIAAPRILYSSRDLSSRSFTKRILLDRNRTSVGPTDI